MKKLKGLGRIALVYAGYVGTIGALAILGGLAGFAASGCATSTQGKVQQGLVALADSKKISLDGWAQYVVAQERAIAALPAGTNRDAAILSLHSKRSKVEEADAGFDIAWITAFNAAVAGSISTVPGDLQTNLAGFVSLVSGFSK